jgi:uncharacterized protein
MKRMSETVLVLIIAYSFICIGIYVYQDKLIFFPPAPDVDVYQMVHQNEIELLINKKKLHGWKINVDPTAKKTLLYFGGNSEDVVGLNFEAKEFSIKQCITFNYSGYGQSKGIPTQESLYSNALEIYDTVSKKYNLKSENIVIFGRSLGSSVATYLAANRESAGVILITPFDSIENIAANHYKFLPVKFILKHRFPTIDYINKIKVPILMLAAEKDEIIADINLQNLDKNTGKNTRLIRYANVGHNTIQTHKDYYAEINEFIGSL